MIYEPLPEILTKGMKIACPKWYEHPEVVEIVKLDTYGRVRLRRENGLVVWGIFTQQLLRDFDYQLAKG